MKQAKLWKGAARFQSFFQRLKDLAREGRSRLPAFDMPAFVGLDEDGHLIYLCKRLQGSNNPLEMIKITKDSEGTAKLSTFNGDLVVCQADLGATMIQDLQLSITQPQSIAQVLPYQLEHILPFSCDHAKVAFHIAQQNSKGSVVHVACTSIEKLQSLVHHYEDMGLEIDYCTSSEFAALAAHRDLQPHLSIPCLYAVAREQSVWFILIDHSRVWGAREAIFSSDSFDTQFLMREAKKTLLYLQAPSITERCLVGRLEMVGEEQRLEFDSSLCSQLDINKRSFFLSLGLCLAQQQSDLSAAFFELGADRQQPFHNLLKWQRSIRSLAIASFAAATSIWLLTQCVENRQWQQMQTNAHALVESARERGLLIPELESKYKLNAWLSKSQAMLEKSLSDYPLLPNMPTVRDCLSWFSFLVDEVARGRILSYEYRMETHPDPKHPHAKYRVRVDAEVEVSDFEKAQKFQQELMRAYHWIERPAALQWKAQKERYKISFYLKDKTVYGNG